jgi:MYXO-CTERM domain-containing protein
VELDIDLAAAERTEEARRLIDTAQSDGIVSLGALGGMDLCILGGPMHSVFPDAAAKAWLGLGDRARQKLIDERTADMARRGMLTPPPPGGYGYALAPALGLALAARCRRRSS